MKKVLYVLAIMTAVFSGVVSAQAASDTIASARGRYQVSYKSQLDPIVINQIHSWYLTLTDAEGDPVTGATLTIEGGMPEHNHGLATQPTLTEQGDGVYLLEGIRFHMMGKWELALGISAGSGNDTAVITLEL